MPTAIREVDLATAYSVPNHLDGYPRCMVVFRWHRSVIGRAIVAVHDGHADEAEVAAAARALGSAAAWPWLVETVGYDEAEIGDRANGAATHATVAICTRERPDDLDRALRSVARLAYPNYDVLVVDNAPKTDRTRAVVGRYPSVRYVCEPTPGLDAARNRAMREAIGAIVAFTDDDAMPEPEWLASLVRNFADPRVQCATGLTLPFELETEAQELFENVSPFARGFRWRIFDGQHDNPVDVEGVGAGANMALRRSAIGEVGLFDERLDAGTPTRSGGDHEMFIRLLAAGHRVVYDPAAVSLHRHRRTHQEVVDTIYGYGVGVYAMWTGLLLERRELGMVRLAWSWFRAAHLPELRRTWLRRPPTTASELARAELRGCLRGPAAWFASRRLRTAAGTR